MDKKTLLINMTNSKRLFNILSIINFIIIINLFFIVDLSQSNLSRFSNISLYNYLFMLIFAINYGYCLFYTLKRLGNSKLAILGLIALALGLLIPYNYLDSGAILSNLHLIFAYISLGSLLLCFVWIIKRIEMMKFKIARLIKYAFMLVCLINIYLYGEYLFVNTLAELLFLSVILVSNIIVINGI